jgi:hypothetical protein
MVPPAQSISGMEIDERKILWCPGMRESTLIFTLSELITRTAGEYLAKESPNIDHRLSLVGTSFYSS